ncbi:MAG: hypothetical protein K1X44_00065 [Alphaproteobacteria bacterium]|nr:hypothetical protein [Alphaproteobacteria bacterium]
MLSVSLRCGAKTRKGISCLTRPIKGKKRCRMHGGTNPGTPHGSLHGRYKHGFYSKKAVEERSSLRALLKATQDLLADLKNQ